MYLITTHDATSTTPRFRMPELCPESISGAFIEGRVAGAAALSYGVVVPASFKDANLGVRAWSPPV
ncbi:MAG: hypothetical protein QOI51_2635 [Nocardioidaceae bacterium]|jgi:hypothetical protein|nr:hypothetical protein [Nocardioidaceae bacterium]MDX6310312.1 hypothetical protein [Nocardioidaceae bacterium]